MTEGECALLKRLRDRDERAFRELVTAHRDRVFNITYRMLGNRHEAEDVAQEVFIAVFKQIDTFREESTFRPGSTGWPSTTARTAREYQRRRAKGAHREFDEISDRDALGTTSMNTSTRLPGPHEVVQGLEAERQVQPRSRRCPRTSGSSSCSATSRTFPTKRSVRSP